MLRRAGGTSIVEDRREHEGQRAPKAHGVRRVAAELVQRVHAMLKPFLANGEGRKCVTVNEFDIRHSRKKYKLKNVLIGAKAPVCRADVDPVRIILPIDDSLVRKPRHYASACAH